MKTATFLLHAGVVAMALAAAGCKPHGDGAQLKTKFPGMVTADGGTSGQVMAAHGGPKTDATYAGGTPGIAGGAGGTSSGAATAGTVTETGKGPSQGVSAPGPASMPGGGPSQQPSGDNKPAPAPAAAEQTPQPAAAHRDPGASQAAPGR